MLTTSLAKCPAVSVSVAILANNAPRAHHASAHGGVSSNGLSDICLIFFEILLSCLKFWLCLGWYMAI